MFGFLAKQFRQPRGLGGKFVSMIMKKRNQYFYDKLIPMLDIKAGDNILEIGYGPGKGVNFICSTYDCNVTGIDFSPLMYKEAGKRNRKYIRAGKAELNLGNYLEFEKHGFNKIFFMNVTYFWDSLNEPFTKLYKDLEKGGLLCFYMTKPELLEEKNLTNGGVFNKHSLDDVLSILDSLGFSDIDVDSSDKFGYFVKCKK